MTPEKTKRLEEINVRLDQVDEAISELFDRAVSFASDGRAAERVDRFQFYYKKEGGPIVQKLDRILADISQIDPQYEARTTWASVLESKGLYYRNLANFCLIMRRRFEHLAFDRPSSPFASSDESDAYREAKAAYSRAAELRGDDWWTYGLPLGEVHWRLGEKDQALRSLNACVANSQNPESRVKAQELIEEITAYSPEREAARAAQAAAASSSCIIATACMGDDRVVPLRKLRDDAIASDPIARDFFHVFWSRYYEWSPGVARIASQDPAVAEHIRWGFLDPWLAWLEFASSVGQRSVTDLSDDERRVILQHLGARLESWVAELPKLMEGKCPADASQMFDAFERFRASAGKMFNA